MLAPESKDNYSAQTFLVTFKDFKLPFKPPSISCLCFFCWQTHPAGHREAEQDARGAHPGVRPTLRGGQQAAPDGPPRNRQHQRLLVRGGEPRRQHPHPAPGGPGSEGLLRGPSPRRKLWPVLRDEGHRSHLPAGLRRQRGGPVKPHRAECRRVRLPEFTWKMMSVQG